MNLTKDQVEAALEVIDHVNMLGSTDHIDDELAKDIVTSFIDCGQITFTTLNNRPVCYYEDDKRSYYMYADSFRPLKEEEIASLDQFI